jgi:hypothetical protein
MENAMAYLKHWRRLTMVAVLAAVAAAGVFAASDRRLPTYNTADGLAVGGYDPVSYFPEGGGQPQLGDARWTAERDGRHYRFVSEANRATFLATPERFEPQYGGWCAYAVAHGYKYEVDPKSYLVAGNRLMLFYRGDKGDARAAFEQEGVGPGVKRADANWPSLAAK